MPFVPCFVAAFTATLFATAVVLADDPSSERPYGIAERTPWTTSRLRGSPEPPLPFRAVPTFESLKFTRPLHIVNEPGTNRLLVIEQSGRIVRFPNDPAVREAELFLEIGQETYGLTFHPDYAANGYVYVVSNGPKEAKVKKNRVSRFTVPKEIGKGTGSEPKSGAADMSSANGSVPVPDQAQNAPRPTVDKSTELVILEWESNGHNGGDLAFGPDGYLYIPAGDGTSDSDTNDTGQDLGNLNATMIRIDVDHPDKDRPYSIPADNPFVHLEGTRPEIWAYGFRNPWRCTFDAKTGHLWVGNIGQDHREMIHLVRRGENYGWSAYEGSSPFHLNRRRGPTPIVQPTVEHPHSVARSITGGIVYYGAKFPELHGCYLYGDYATGRIWAVRHDGTKITYHQEIADTTLQILAFGTDPQGEIYLVDYGGGIAKLEHSPPVTSPHPFPRKLSETGLFVSVKNHETAPGVIPYSVNAPLWSDGAHKERFIALPGDLQIDFTSRNGWNFPDDAVLVKTFALELEAGRPESRRRIETRIMLKQQGEWAGYTYLWNDAQTDAVLVESAGADRVYMIADPAAPGGRREQTWHFPSRAECMVCHSRAANYVLGPSTPQMNRLHDYGGVVDNQLRTLAHIGVLKMPKKSPAEYQPLADPADTAVDLEARARAYLHANCANCHVAAGGGNSRINLHIATPLDETMLLNADPQHQTFGIENAKLIVPGDPDRSLLYQRLIRRGKGQMPPLGSSRVDENAAKLIRDWIAGIK